jgi:hypothetical protein
LEDKSSSNMKTASVNLSSAHVILRRFALKPTNSYR